MPEPVEVAIPYKYFWRLTFLLALGVLPAVAQSDSATSAFFESRIRPVLVERCYACHTDSKLGGLRVDSRVALLEGGKRGPAIVVGAPENSLLIRAVSMQDTNLKMPMAGEKLKDNEIADLVYWIKIGAPWPQPNAAPLKPASTQTKKFTIRPDQRNFWAFQPLAKQQPPAVKNAIWARTPIDRFILAKLEEKGLTPAGPADKRTLLRRVSYDLTGLPPTPEQLKAFLENGSPDAFAGVVDRLLASPQFGERWGQHWLDVARYADLSGRPEGRMVFLGYGMAKDGYANTWRYRDWVIQAFNRDMPYDLFVKAQIAADLLPESEAKERSTLMPGLGLFGIGPWFTGDDKVFVEARADERDDKVDVLTKGFLGLTLTCARCHDHKYDPLSQKDYTALAGVFGSSGYWEYNQVPAAEVDQYKAQVKKVRDLENAISDYADVCSMRLAETLTARTADYMMAARKILRSKPALEEAKVAEEERLHGQTLGRWVKYLRDPDKEHPYLREWQALMNSSGGTDEAARRLAEQFQERVLRVIAEKKVVNAANIEMKLNYKPDPNEARVLLPGDLVQFELFQYKQKLVEKVVDTNSYYVYRDVIHGGGDPNRPTTVGLFEYTRQGLQPFLTPEEKSKLDGMQAELSKLTSAVPKEYPYLMGLKDNEKPSDLKLNIRGNAHALGDVVPRGLPAILGGTEGEPLPFTEGSGRLQLAEAIARHPLAARVIVNRVWMYLFGRGIVDTPGNFGLMGERPTHPELLDYLAQGLVDNHWSLKTLIREILLTATYQESSAYSDQAAAVDVDNRLLSRASLRRLDAESIRDSMLFVSGVLDERLGGPPEDMGNPASKRRTIYQRPGRSGDRFLQLFDLPVRGVDSDQRSITNTPLQGLFFLNSEVMARQAQLLNTRVQKDGATDSDQASGIQRLYQLLYQRAATSDDLERGRRFLHDAETPADRESAWQQYAQVLLSAPEFYYIN